MPQIETAEAQQQLEEALQPFDDRRSNLIAILQQIQATFYYLPESALQRVSRKLQVPMSEVYQVATFYRCFSLKPRGKHLVQVCLGTACHVRGGDLILERAETEAGVAAPGNTSADLQFTVEPVRCLGCCGLAPVMRVDKDTFAHLEQGKVRGVLNKYRPRAAKTAAKKEETGAADD
jgi:NADH-quinone oxidoreductase subunit E